MCSLWVARSKGDPRFPPRGCPSSLDGPWQNDPAPVRPTDSRATASTPDDAVDEASKGSPHAAGDADIDGEAQVAGNAADDTDDGTVVDETADGSGEYDGYDGYDGDEDDNEDDDASDRVARRTAARRGRPGGSGCRRRS